MSRAPDGSAGRYFGLYPAIVTDIVDPNSIGRVQAYTAGYAHDVDLIPHVATGIGAQITVYNSPDPLKAAYGNHPVGAVIFLRCRPFGKQR